MSSPNSPYKSRFFNWLNRQYIGLSDRLGKNLRHLQVAAKWGVQLLLYPVYFLVQTARIAGRQLGNKTKTQKKLTPNHSLIVENSLQTIDTLLQEVKPLVVEVVNSNYETNQPNLLSAISTSDIIPINHNNKLIIRGIASLLESQEIVIVTKENNILAIFSDEQQKKLKDIVNQVLKIQTKELAINPKFKVLPKIKYNNPHIIPAIRQFWQLMSWIQDSNFARQINLFGEAYLTVNTSPSTSIVSQSAYLSNDTFNGYVTDIHALIAAAIAYFFGQHPSSFKDNPNHLSFQEKEEIKQLPFPKQVKPKITNNLDLIKQKIQKSFAESPKAISAENEPFKIKAIIQAGIDYFLGDSLPNRVSDYEANQKLKPSLPAEEWLSLEDIFLENQANNKQPNNTQIIKSLGVNKSKKNKAESKNNKQTKKTQKKRETNTNISLIASINIENNTKQLPPVVIIEEQSSLPNINHQEEDDILETEVTSLGYEKHFLERILEWLDQILLWLENLLIKIWYWLKRFRDK